MMKLTQASKYVWILLGLLVIGLVIWGIVWMNDRHGYNGKLSVEALEERMTRAQEYTLAEEADSALMVFAEVANATSHETTPDLVRIRARAFNNMGYVLTYLKHDYPAAYRFYLKALTDAKAAKFEKMYAYVYLNIGNVKLAVSRDSALVLYREAFNAAVEAKSPDIVNTAYTNMINVAITEAKLPAIHAEMNSYEHLDIPDSVALSKFTGLMHRGAKLMMSHQYRDAAEVFGEAQDNIDTSLTPLYYEAQTLGNKSEALLALGDTLEAIKTITEMENAAIRAKTPEVRWNLYAILSTLYSKMGQTEIARDYYIRHLELADSIFRYRDGHHLDNVTTQVRLDEMVIHYNQLHMSHLRSQLLLLGGGIVLLLIIIFSVVTYLQKRRATELLKTLYMRDRDLKKLENLPVLHVTAEESTMPLALTDGDATPVKYRTSSLTAADKERYASLLTKIADENEALFQIGFTITQLAAISGLKDKEVSQIINEVWHMNFNAWVNTYRCRAARTRLTDPSYDSLTIEAIGEGLGFRSRSHFASVFKQATGMSPAEYRRVSRLV